MLASKPPFGVVVRRVQKLESCTFKSLLVGTGLNQGLDLYISILYYTPLRFQKGPPQTARHCFLLVPIVSTRTPPNPSELPLRSCFWSQVAKALRPPATSSHVFPSGDVTDTARASSDSDRRCQRRRRSATPMERCGPRNGRSIDQWLFRVRSEGCLCFTFYCEAVGTWE